MDNKEEFKKLTQDNVIPGNAITVTVLIIVFMFLFALPWSLGIVQIFRRLMEIF